MMHSQDNSLKPGPVPSRDELEDVNLSDQELLPTPAQLKAEMPLTESAARSVAGGREAIGRILRREDPRLIVVVGPCSIHDTRSAIEYAERLAALAPRVSGQLLLVMRTYFEKPRTTVGWKGLINDPYLNDTFAVADGLRLARTLLLELAELGLPLSTEALDPITPQYLQDLVSWSAIGARTAESQTHREMASGLSSAVGFKNGTDGSLDVAINALQSVACPHRFLGIDQNGQVAVFHTRGNPLAHVVLRGGSAGPNYEQDAVETCEQALKKLGGTPNIMIDCSHANSRKQHERQLLVAGDVIGQIEAGNSSIIGLMIESHLEPGNQPLVQEGLRYGVSITDACIGWDDTERLLLEAADRLSRVLKCRAA
ncbi:MAG: 3-deoxy-7-phosphoheptulonate synthase [Pseudomonadota bacterium]